MANRLSQGQPLTYDYLASLESEIDNLSARVTKLGKKLNNYINGDQNDNNDNNTGGQDISVSIDRLAKLKTGTFPKDVLILASSIPIIWPGGNAKPVVFNIEKFDRSFKYPPIVTATVHDPGAAGPGSKNGPNVAFATVTLGPISRTQFTYKVEMVRGGNVTNKDLTLNYIAIGPK